MYGSRMGDPLGSPPCCTRFCAPSGQNLSRRPPRRWFWASEFAVTATQSVSWGSERAFRNGAAIAIPSSFEKVRMVSARACRVRYAVGLVGIGGIRQWRFRDRSRVFRAPVVDAPSATCPKARDDAHKTSAIIPALKHRIPSELRS